MSLEKVTGSDCLNYISKPIGFGSHHKTSTYSSLNEYVTANFMATLGSDVSGFSTLDYRLSLGTLLGKLRHDTSKRIVGLVLDKYGDGGLKVALLGNETFHISDQECIQTEVGVGSSQKYDYSAVAIHAYTKDDVELPLYPTYVHRDFLGVNTVTKSQATMCEQTEHGTRIVEFDEFIDFTPTFYQRGIVREDFCEYRGQPTTANYFEITNDKNNTLVYGVGLKNVSIEYDADFISNPLGFLSGNLYGFASDKYFNNMVSYPSWFDDYEDLRDWRDYSHGSTLTSFNLCAIPFNLLLTESESFAQAYLDNGTLPPDAYLYPLDWENLPSYQQTETEPPDNPDDNIPDDNGRGGNPNPPQVPTYTPSMLSNYNWYWLSVPDYSAFLTWFWNDIGNYNDFSDLIAKVEGLYNDVASAVLMVRYFPVEISWIGGLGTQSNIKVGMIEKNGAVDTISQTQPPAVRDIGHIHIPTKYNSFCDLAPYTELSLYLPFHGFIDMDIDILMGHDLYVKGVYDYLTGTLQYMIYVDNLYLINTVIVKLAVDIPITLQTKNDRDSAVFSNVTSTVGGLIGAGLGIATGNPIGITMGVANGVQSLNANNTSAPLNVKGTVGESGALYCPPQCAIILRRPTIQSSDGTSSLKTWKKNVGNMCGYGYTLSSLVGKGLTVCYTPRINFTKSTPMQSEVEEIYTYLQEGVIL